MDKPKLLDLIRNEIRLRHFSIRTEKAYVGWVYKYVLFHNKKHPIEMGEKEVMQYLSYLAVNRNVSKATQNQTFNALLFLYRNVLHKPLGDPKAEYRM